MHQIKFNYDAQTNHLKVTVSDPATDNELEIIEYWHLYGNGFEHRRNKVLDVATWRENEAPMTRLESLAAASRLAYIDTLPLIEQFRLVHDSPNIEHNDIKWLFDDIDKAYSINSHRLVELDPFINFEQATSNKSNIH